MATIIRGLLSGKSQKEITALTGVSYHTVRQIICRYPTVHQIYVETQPVRAALKVQDYSELDDDILGVSQNRSTETK